MMMKYYKQEEETNYIIRMHEDGLRWVHTGDIGRISEDGFLTVVGRIKRIICVRKNGIYHKIFPKLVEDELTKVVGVDSIVIVGRKKPVVENELIAFVVKKSGTGENELLEKIFKYAYAHLESWERPDEYHFVDEIPRTAVGKVNYRELEERVDGEL